MIRSAQSGDSLGMGRVYCLSWKEAYKGIVPQPFLDSLTPENSAPPPERISAKNSFVFEEKGEIVGLVNFGAGRDGGDDNMGELRSIYVLPEYWHRGVGRELFHSAAGGLKAAGYCGFYLWVLTDNARARRFYERMGMAADGKHTIEIAGRELPETRYLYTF